MIERITYKYKFSRQATLLLFSRLLERAAFYGFRSLFVLYMTSEVIDLERSEALTIYGWFTGGLVISYIIGAITSDLKIGNRNGIILGGLLQAVGAIVLCIQTLNGLYIGLFLILLGSGFYSPNIQAQFGKLYLAKPKVLDASFSLFFLIVNLGAFTGPLLIGYIGEEINYSYGFIIAAVLSICSVILILFTKHPVKTLEFKPYFGVKIRVILFVLVFILGGLYWGINEIGGGAFYNLYQNFTGLKELNLPRSLFVGLNSFFTIPLSIVALFIWSYYYYNPFIKLTIGFALAGISFTLLLLMATHPSDFNLVILIASVFLLSIADTHISPIVLSVATKYANPKYLATILSFTSIPTLLFVYLAGLVFINHSMEEPLSSFILPSILMGVIGLGLIVGIVILRKKYSAILYD